MPFPSSAGTKVGLEIWRIEKLEPATVERQSYGSFHSGDAYIVLNTFEKKGAIHQDVHFWLGKDCSQDEQGAAAYQTVALDDQLGGRPVQHREVQGHESNLFLSYFPKGIVYLDGGIASAFNHVKPDDYRPRLLQCKGKRIVRCNEVEFSSASLNEGDVFILDKGLTIYQWNGNEANRYEKFKGLEISTKIKDQERGGKAKLIVLESGRDDQDANFWNLLGPRSAVQSASAGGSDDAIKQEEAKLFRVSDASGSLQVTLAGQGRLDKNLLDANDVFLLDTSSEVFVWIGKGATKEERSKGLLYAQQYLSENGRPQWTPLTRIPAGGETPVFKSFFTRWDSDIPKTTEEKTEHKAKTVSVDALYTAKQRDAEEKMLDTSGKVEIWRIENLNKVPVEPSTYGQFYSGDSYIILYSYKIANKNAWIIYFWQGRNSSTDEKATAALLAKDLDDSLGGEPVQVRVVQGKEPNHFLSLFKGKFIVHEGGVASGFANRQGQNVSIAQQNVRLYHIRGTNALNTRAVQVEATATSLNSGDCFTLVSPSTIYLWHGKGANNDERSFAQSISNILASGRSVVELTEGNEPNAFWEALGGKCDYPSSRELESGQKEPRLFQCSSVGNGFAIEEVFNYTQDDLIQECVFILDAYSEVFVWVGRDARKEDKDLSLKAALDYVTNAPDGRSADTPVFRVQAGGEPPNFTCHFLGWDTSKATDFTDPYLKKLGQLKGISAPEQKVAERVSADMIGYQNAAVTKYPIGELQGKCPGNVDPQKKEYYLNDDDFKRLFGMDLPAFEKLALWKRQEAKRKNGIF